MEGESREPSELTDEVEDQWQSSTSRSAFCSAARWCAGCVSPQRTLRYLDGVDREMICVQGPFLRAGDLEQ